MRIRKRADHTFANFCKRTIAAQMHLLTAIAAVFGLIFLLPLAKAVGPLHYWGTLVFCITSIILFATSAIYHFISDGYESSPRVVEVFEKLDQSAIYLFIAGTYTPFLINSLITPWREFLVTAVWVIAFVGIFYTLFRHRLPLWAQSRLTYTSVFLIMGWIVMVRIQEVWARDSAWTLGLLFAGGMSYSIGAVVYILKKPRLFEGIFGFHELWHVFVSLGFAFHFAMILSFY